MKRIRLLRSIGLNGGEHAEKGEIHDAPAPLAHRLVGEGSAEYLEAEAAPTSVNRMMQAGNADPRTTKVSDGPSPVVEEGDEEENGEGDEKEKKHGRRGKK